MLDVNIIVSNVFPMTTLSKEIPTLFFFNYEYKKATFQFCFPGMLDMDPKLEMIFGMIETFILDMFGKSSSKYSIRQNLFSKLTAIPQACLIKG